MNQLALDRYSLSSNLGEMVIINRSSENKDGVYSRRVNYLNNSAPSQNLTAQTTRGNKSQTQQHRDSSKANVQLPYNNISNVIKGGYAQRSGNPVCTEAGGVMSSKLERRRR